MPKDGQGARSSHAAADAVAGLLSSHGPPANPPSGSAKNPASAESAADAGLIPTVTFQKGDREGTHLDRYRLESLLGRGGMGVVWLAYDPRLNRRVAIKIVRPDLNLGPEALDHFLAEGRRLANLNHADILPVYDCGQDQGVWYLVSEYVPGGTLADQLKHDSFSDEQAAELVARVAEAAHYAHSRGLVHRDIKPANILMREDGKPLLADFGLAIAEDEQLREAPGTLGTYAYMAPEQMLGESRFVDGRADIYSLGVVLYQLLTGRLPYVASTPEDYRELVLKRDPRPPRSVRQDIPAALEAICLKCLARHPGERYTTAADLATALRQTVSNSAAPRHRRASALALTAVVALVIVFGIWRWNQSGAPAEGGNVDVKPVVPAPGDDGQRTKTPSDDVVAVVELKHSNPATTWEVSPAGESVRFFCDDVALFQLGDDRSGDLELSVTIEQNPWLGGMGVFWGYRATEEDRERERYEYFALYPRVGDEKMRLRNALVQLRADKNGLTQEDGLAVLSFADELKGKSHRIGFTIRGGELVGLHWDDTDLRGLVEQRARSLGKEASAQGGFGLIGNRSHGVFLQPQLNGRSIRFAPGSKARSSD